ncbi:MAG: hypothetical protein U1F83_15610 [Verrucomicrobiota bacterium]
MLVLLVPWRIFAGQPAQFYCTNVASLIDPVKLATLGKRGANPCMQKAVAQLELARRDGHAIPVVVSNAVWLANYTNAGWAAITSDALLRNHDIARRLGVFDSGGLEDMRQGRSPTIRQRPYDGDELSVDRLVPVVAAPELDNVIGNLLLLPRRLNAGKGDKIGMVQVMYANQFYALGLISSNRMAQIEGRLEVWSAAKKKQTSAR